LNEKGNLLLTFREERKMRVLENRVAGKLFEVERENKKEV
jgi:hypothetical protein